MQMKPDVLTLDVEMPKINGIQLLKMMMPQRPMPCLLYTSGLSSHQTRMDVIGNNISNVHTVGFQKSTTTFQDVYSQTLTPASAPSGNLGGTNAKQVGLGASVASVVIQHTPGAAQYTGCLLYTSRCV